MRSKFWVYASLGLVAAASLGVVTTFAYAASGQVALVKSNINITTPDIEITYDGEEHIYGDKKGSYIGELNVGDGIVFAEDKTTCFKAGTYRNRVKYQIINSNGQNVNKDYNIKEDFGIIQIKKRTLNVSVKEEFMSTVPTGKNEISVEKLNITGDGIASNDDVTIYCDKKSYNGTLKFNFSLKSYNSTYNVNTTNCYTVNPEYPYFDENILDYLPPGTQLPDMDEFPPFDPNNMPPGAIQFPTNGGGVISGGPDIESIISKTAIMKVKSDSRGLFLLRGTSYGDYNYLGFNDPTPYSTVGCNYNPNQYFRHYLENQGRRDLQITYLNNFYPQTDFAPYFCTNTDYQSDDINFTFSKDANRTYTVSSYGFIPETNLDVIDTLSSYVDFSYEEENYQNFVYNTY